MKIGVLGLQGDFAEHLRTLGRCGVAGLWLRLPQELDEVSGLIIPGGESTTIGKLLDRYGLTAKIRARAAVGMPIYGTCAGMILLAKEIVGYPEQARLGLMDIAVERNAYGRQVDSFEANVPSKLGDAPLRAVFIRAPVVTQVGAAVEVLAEHEGAPILIQQGNLLASSFHPELTQDLRVHQHFVDMAKKFSG